MLTEKSDEDLMALVANGHKLAFETLVKRHLPLAHAAAWRVCRGHEAEDIVQDAFTKLWVSAPSFRPEKSKFSTWFYRIVINTGIDRMRSRKPTADANWDMMADPADSAEAEVAKREESGQVQSAIAALPDRQRTAISLCYDQGFSNQQAADIMGIHIKALEGLLVRARKTLKSALSQLAETGGRYERQSG
jgi:RNA polymerase sigma-70 factor (ECF subfamily)